MKKAINTTQKTATMFQRGLINENLLNKNSKRVMRIKTIAIKVLP